MARNGKHRPPRPRIEMRQAAASPDEAAAIAAAIEQFLHDTAPAPRAPGLTTTRWRRTASLEQVRSDPSASDPWGEAEPWGR